MFWDSRLKLDLLLSCVNQQKCDKLTGSGFVEKLQHCVSATSSVHSPLCTQTKSAQWSVHSGIHPVGTVQTLSAPWNLLGPPLIPEKKFPATTGRWSNNFVFCNTHCASTCSFCEKTRHLTNVSTWQIEPTHAIYVKPIKWNKNSTPKTSAQIFMKKLLSLELSFPSSKCFCKS